jgi:sodium pump decarboxylase gamma subunit
MIVNSLIITVVGMAVVFAFLILLVAIMKGFSALVVRFFPEEESTTVPVHADDRGSTGAEIAVAIAAAYDRRS